MDDEELYGKGLYTYTFSKAVKNELLAPYKIIILGVDEEEVSQFMQHLITDENYELILDDKTKIIGCYQGLAKIDLKVDLREDPNLMRRALAFCKDINTSKRIHNTFNSKEIQKELYNFIRSIKRYRLLTVNVLILMEYKVPKKVIKSLIGLRKMRGRMSAVF